MLVVGNDIMQLDARAYPRQLKEPPEKLNHLGGTLVLTRDRAPAGDVITEVFGEVLVPQLP